MNILVYSPFLTNRIAYVLSLIFNNLLGIKISITSDILKFKSDSNPKFIYGPNTVDNYLFFKSVKLLWENSIKPQKINIENHNNLKVLFFFESVENSALPFDPFAAIFYMVSRYEEYLPFQTDDHGRYRAEDSIAFKNNFLNLPIVHYWAEMIKAVIVDKFPSLKFKSTKYNYISTFDIDNAYAVRHKSLLRTLGALMKNLRKNKLNESFHRFLTILRLQHDEYDTYDFIVNWNKKYNIDTLFFFLIGDYNSFDKNLNFKNNAFRKLIYSLSKKFKVGIHPSYHSNDTLSIIKKEKERLSTIINKPVVSSRNHYLKIRIPQTYRALINCGIEEDYSMYFASQPGFRAGICIPYNFYDLENEVETSLKIFPTIVMEGTLKDYKNLPTEEAKKVYKFFIGEVKKVNGQFISLWHNESVSDRGKWKGWKEVFEYMSVEAMNIND